MPGLFDYEDQLKKINAHQPPLNKLDKIIDWKLFYKIRMGWSWLLEWWFLEVPL